jgi:hypothetical protein
VLPAQHGWLPKPQVTHMPVLSQIALDWQTLPAQQGWPPNPQAIH